MNQCDYGHDTKQETRLLPIGGGGNLIVCKRHYQRERAYCDRMVKDGTWEKSNLTNFPKWEDLKVYAEG